LADNRVLSIPRSARAYDDYKKADETQICWLWVGTINVETMTETSEEVVEMVGRRILDFCRCRRRGGREIVVGQWISERQHYNFFGKDVRRG
jgi:hypothetical protein